MTRLLVTITVVQFIWTVSAFFLHNNNGHQSNIVRTMGNRRFEFVLSEYRYWSDASDSCRRKGGHLAKIPDLNTQNFVMNTLRSVSFADSSIWIGLNDRSVEGHWTWDDGQTLTGYTHWGYGETAQDATHAGQDCVVVELVDNGLWHDKPCHFVVTYNYICEFGNAVPQTNAPMTAPTTIPTQAPAPSTTTTTTTTPKPTQPSCQPPDCDATCPMGYSGLYVDANGCIACSCI